jgi:CBS domain-containing protein
MLKPAVAGVLVGLIGLAAPAALGTGYGWLQKGMHDGLSDTALWIILALPFLKILTTSLSIGSGGSGGIFGPGMVIGGMVGLGLWRVLEGTAPGMPHVPAPFIVVGMISCFGSVAHAPLGLMLMVAEMTGSLALLPPAMVAIGLAALVVGEDTIYEGQLRSRAESPAHRAAFGLPLLNTISIADAMVRPRVVIDGSLSAAEALRLLAVAGVAGAPVTRAEGDYAGVIVAAADDGSGRLVSEILDPDYPTVPVDGTLDFVLDALVSSDVGWVPALDGRQIAGIVAMHEVIAAYQRALRRSLHLLAGAVGSTTLVEATVGPGSGFDGVTIADAPWPSGSIALSIDRQSQLVVPRSDLVMCAGDVVVAVTTPGTEAELRRNLQGGAV